MQTVDLNLIPGAVLPVINVSQYDEGRQFALNVLDGTVGFDLTGKYVKIRGTKPDKKGFEYGTADGVVSVSGSVATIKTTQQMTAVGGKTVAELQISVDSELFTIGLEENTVHNVTAVNNGDGTFSTSGIADAGEWTTNIWIGDITLPAGTYTFTGCLPGGSESTFYFYLGVRTSPQLVIPLCEEYGDGVTFTLNESTSIAVLLDFHGGANMNGKTFRPSLVAGTTPGNTVLGTLNFILDVEPSALSDDTDISETVLPDVIDAGRRYAQAAEESAGEAEQSASDAAGSATDAAGSAGSASTSAGQAEDKALVSEGYAEGTQHGIPVGPDSPYYERNAKYYSEAIADAAAEALKAEGYAVGTQNGIPVGIGSPYYHNNAEYLKDLANPTNLMSMTDVDINSPASGQTLVFNPVTNKWENGTGGAAIIQSTDPGEGSTLATGQFLVVVD